MACEVGAVVMTAVGLHTTWSPVAGHLLTEACTTSVTPMYQAITPLCYQYEPGGFPRLCLQNSVRQGCFPLWKALEGLCYLVLDWPCFRGRVLCLGDEALAGTRWVALTSDWLVAEWPCFGVASPGVAVTPVADCLLPRTVGEKRWPGLLLRKGAPS